MDRRHHDGRQAEDLACRYLEAQGLRLLERNYRCAAGELDLVMRDGRNLVFVEVRYRRHNRFGTPAESVDRRKQAKLTAAALHYLQAKGSKQAARFDVIAVSPSGNGFTVQWIPDAFQT